jgi:hypothetical protein
MARVVPQRMRLRQREMGKAIDDALQVDLSHEEPEPVHAWLEAARCLLRR